ncbi:MAG: serine/threonine protein kinase [Candidatus Obscuribacterales bacterium]|nr:serine/threonine protein kinase [Candidatus Obscuribacterales bacterium]
MPETKVGTIIDNKYQLLEEVGAGGMGLVYKAKQQGLERIVAIKILEPTLVSDNDSLARFEREARSISLLNHIHIASFYSYGIHESHAPYIAMEFLEGKNLKSLIQETDDGLEWQRAAKICLQICDAMDYAHSQGVVHRDLKPNNIILLSSPQADWVKVVDFGLAKLADLTDSGKQRLTKTGELLGSVDYLSPEQCLGRQTDQRSDIYSLACILFEMLTGRTPFESDNPIGQIHKHANEESPLITTVSQKLFPPGLELLIKKSLAKDPADRYQSMADLALDLKLILDGKGGELVSSLAQYGQRKRKKAGANKGLVLSIGIAFSLLAIACGAGWFYFTDAGISYQARTSLTSNPNLATRLEWLRKADKLENEGKAQTAQLVRAEVLHPFAASNEDDFGIAKMYLTLANEYKDKGETALAAKAGWQALQEMSKVTKPGAYPTVVTPRSKLYLETIEDAALMSSLNPGKFNKTDAGMLQKFSRPMMNVPGPFTLNLVDLLERVVDDSRMPANEDTVECYRLRASYLSTRNPLELRRLLKAASKASREALRLHGPHAAAHLEAWAEATRNLAGRGYPKEALASAKKVEASLDGVEPKSDNKILNNVISETLHGYLALGMQADAERLAQKLKSYSCMQTEECTSCASAYQVLSSVIVRRNREEGTKALLRSAQLYNSLDYIDNPEAIQEYEKVLRQLIRASENKKLSPDLKAQISEGLKKAKQFCQKHKLDQSYLSNF